MDDAEYKKLWAMIDDAHIRIGRLESEKSMLIESMNELIDANDAHVIKDVDIRIALNRANQLLETMKGE